MISITINGKSLQVAESLTVLQAAEQAGITIPTLCYHKDLTPYGGCRLCVVEIEGSRLPATSCTMPVSRGMVIETETPKLIHYRRFILESLLSKYYDAGYTRSNGQTNVNLDTQFAHWVSYYGIDIKSTMAKKPIYPVDSDPNPFVWVDMNKCILCTRCIRACAEIQGRFVWGMAYRGYDSRIVPGMDTTMLQARCESCGACVAYCPTGALDNKLSINMGHPDRTITTTCSYCSVGCQLNLNIKNDVPGGRVFRVTSSSEPSVNGMHLCVKGRYGYDFIHSSTRLANPRVRKYLLERTSKPAHRDPWVEVDWDKALDITSAALQQIQETDGPEKMGFLVSGRLLNEEAYLANKFARQVLGTNNIDLCNHVSHRSVVSGLENTIWLWGQSNSLEDVANNARSMLIIGSNTTEEHPVFGAKIRQAVLRRGCKLVVTHPDFINMSEYAALRLVHRRNTDNILINGLIDIILENGWQNHEFIEKYTHGFEELRASISKYTPEAVSQETGVPVETLQDAARLISTNRPMAVVWGTDLADNKSGEKAVISLVNLQLVTGNLGVPGGGLIPLRTQNNSQGACDMGALPTMLPGYQPISEIATQKKFETAWGNKLPTVNGYTAREMISAVSKGGVTGLFVIGEDIVSDVSNSPGIRKALQSCKLVILQEALISETSYYADIHLPGVSFAEKSGTFTSTERRVQMVNQGICPIANSRPDWMILRDIANRLFAHKATKSGQFSSWNYEDTTQIMDEIASLTPIYSGISQQRLTRDNGLQWPVGSSNHPGTPMLLPDEHWFGMFIPPD